MIPIMKTTLLKACCIGSILLPYTVHGDVASDIRNDWSISPAYEDRHINKVAFTQNLYGITWAHWLVAVSGYDELSSHILDGEYHLIGFDIAEVATGEAFQRLAEQALELPLLSTRILTIYELGLNALAYSMEVNALAIQHNRYFQARPYNSYQTILNLEPFELLDGVNMTKEGNGWLFTFSGYLTPYPSGNHITPPLFYALAESAWQTVNADPALLNQEQQLLKQRFLAQLAVTLAGETVIVAPLSNDSASVQWNCAPGVAFHIEHSTNLSNWTRTGPHTSAGDSMHVTLSALPASQSRYFRIVCQP
jgi:hypothetical protein